MISTNKLPDFTISDVNSQCQLFVLVLTDEIPRCNHCVVCSCGLKLRLKKNKRDIFDDVHEMIFFCNGLQEGL